MIRKIIVPTDREYVLQIPESFIGKNIEVLAFEVKVTTDEPAKDKGSFSERTKGLRFHSGGYQFNREEANDYE